MKYKVEKNFDKINGTHLQGYVTVDFAKLVKLFGKPLESDGYKVDAEWIISSKEDQSIVATIYNYKNGKNYLGSEGLEVKDITNWNVGGHTEKALIFVGDILSSHVQTLEERHAEFKKLYAS